MTTSAPDFNVANWCQSPSCLHQKSTWKNCRSFGRIRARSGIAQQTGQTPWTWQETNLRIPVGKGSDTFVGHDPRSTRVPLIQIRLRMKWLRKPRTPPVPPGFLTQAQRMPFIPVSVYFAPFVSFVAFCSKSEQSQSSARFQSSLNWRGCSCP